MALLSIVITASLDRAADSIAEVVTANAGSSVLTECNKNLYDKFGVLAIQKNEDLLSNLADYYISESVDGLNRFVHLHLNAAMVDIEDRTDLYVTEFKKQISELGFKGLIVSKAKATGLTSFAGNRLPSFTHSGADGLAASSVLMALNGNLSIGTGAGITQYVMNTFTDEEIEYLLFGMPDIESNRQSTRNLIFAIRCLIDCVEDIKDPIMIIEAIARAWRETDEIMSNKPELERYLKAMVYVMSSSNKLAYRIMDVMQMTVGGDFNFENYAYSFELTAQFSRGKKSGVVVQKHSYTY